MMLCSLLWHVEATKRNSYKTLARTGCVLCAGNLWKPFNEYSVKAFSEDFRGWLRMCGHFCNSRWKYALVACGLLGWLYASIKASAPPGKCLALNILFCSILSSIQWRSHWWLHSIGCVEIPVWSEHRQMMFAQRSRRCCSKCWHTKPSSSQPTRGACGLL